jgi:hypothetical protein
VTGAPYPWIVTTTAMVNHYYFYGVEDDFGPFFVKFCSYFPYTARLCVNGNEYTKRQATKAGIDFEALDNGFATVADPQTVQQMCDGLTEDKIDALLRTWPARLPHPYTSADRAAGYCYEVSMLQAELQRPGDLRPQTPTAPRVHRTCPAQPPLPSHRHRTPSCPLPEPNP